MKSWLLLFFLLSSFAKAQISALLNMEEAQLGDVVELSVTVKGTLDKDLDFSEIQGQEGIQLRGSGKSSSYSYENGKSSYVTTYTYALIPTQAGNYTIPSLKASISGKLFETKELTLKVSPASSSYAGESGEEGEGEEQEKAPLAFITREYSKKEVFTGEPLVQTIKLYFSVKVQNIQPNTFAWNDFRTLDFEPRVIKERYKGKLYQVYVIQKILVPLKSNNYDIGPFVVHAELLFENPASSRSRSRWSFFGGGGYSVKEKSFATDKAYLVVKPLPSSRPKDYNGLVGHFSMKAKLSDEKLEVGETSTLTITIEGDGLLDGAAQPKLDLPKGIKVYPDKPELEEKQDPKKGFVSRKTFKYALVPTKKGSYDLGFYQESYFDWDEKEFRSLKAELGSLEVTGEDLKSSVAFSSGASAQKMDVESLGADLVDLKRGLSLSQLKGSSGTIETVLILLASGFSLIYLLLLLWPRLLAFAPGRSSKKRKAGAYKAYLAYKKRMGSSHSGEKISDLFKSFLADRFDLKSGVLTSKELKDLLGKSSLAKDLQLEVISCFDDLEKMAFGYSSDKGKREGELLKKVHELVKKVDQNA